MCVWYIFACIFACYNNYIYVYTYVCIPYVLYALICIIILFVLLLCGGMN